jgi:hypothetical protein
MPRGRRPRAVHLGEGANARLLACPWPYPSTPAESGAGSVQAPQRAVRTTNTTAPATGENANTNNTAPSSSHHDTMNSRMSRAHASPDPLPLSIVVPFCPPPDRKAPGGGVTPTA